MKRPPGEDPDGRLVCAMHSAGVAPRAECGAVPLTACFLEGLAQVNEPIRELVVVLDAGLEPVEGEARRDAGRRFA